MVFFHVNLTYWRRGCRDYLFSVTLVYFQIYICIPKYRKVYIIWIDRLLSFRHQLLRNLGKHIYVACCVLLKALNHKVFILFPEETLQIFDFYFKGVDFFVCNSLLYRWIRYKIDEILLASVALINLIGIAVLIGGDEFLEFGFLFLVSKSSSCFGLHRLILNQCIID